MVRPAQARPAVRPGAGDGFGLRPAASGAGAGASRATAGIGDRGADPAAGGAQRVIEAGRRRADQAPAGGTGAASGDVVAGAERRPRRPGCQCRPCGHRRRAAAGDQEGRRAGDLHPGEREAEDPRAGQAGSAGHRQGRELGPAQRAAGLAQPHQLLRRLPLPPGIRPVPVRQLAVLHRLPDRQRRLAVRHQQQRWQRRAAAHPQYHAEPRAAALPPAPGRGRQGGGRPHGLVPLRLRQHHQPGQQQPDPGQRLQQIHLRHRPGLPRLPSRPRRAGLAGPHAQALGLDQPDLVRRSQLRRRGTALRARHRRLQALPDRRRVLGREHRAGLPHHQRRQGVEPRQMAVRRADRREGEPGSGRRPDLGPGVLLLLPSGRRHLLALPGGDRGRFLRHRQLAPGLHPEGQHPVRAAQPAAGGHQPQSAGLPVFRPGLAVPRAGCLGQRRLARRRADPRRVHRRVRRQPGLRQEARDGAEPGQQLRPGHLPERHPGAGGHLRRRQPGLPAAGPGRLPGGARALAVECAGRLQAGRIRRCGRRLPRSRLRLHQRRRRHQPEGLLHPRHPPPDPQNLVPDALCRPAW